MKKDNVVRRFRKLAPKKLVPVAEEGYRRSRNLALQTTHKFPARGLKIIGVTGTNGKTTTSILINEMLKSGGKRTALFTTAVIELDGEQKANDLNRTVPLTKDLITFLKAAKEKNVDWVVMEVTSHALDQHKFDMVKFDTAVVTNLTQDHLDYHGTMEAYAAAKAKIFNRGLRFAILNRDDEWYDYFAKQASPAIIYSFGEHDGSVVDMRDLTTDASGSRFSLLEHPADDRSYRNEFHTSLLGRFNAYNVAAAVAVGRALKIDDEKIQDGLDTVTSVPGRMEPIKAGQDFTVLVDYAHTPDALKQALTTLKSLSASSIRLVFGATGDRDKSKRPDMGQIAAEYASRIYLTDDEPYTEDPAAIRQEVMKGVAKARGEGKTKEFDDRRMAIEAAISDAKRGDIVIIAGMGHEQFRIVGDKKEPWNEREIVLSILKSRKKGK